MAVAYTIKASVFDLSRFTPTPSESFIVDTNVWYWLTYSRASNCFRTPANYQSTRYPSFINLALSNNSKLFYSGLSIAELIHLIEKSEFEIFSLANSSIFPNPRIFDKKFRHEMPTERLQVVAEINSVINQVTSLSNLLPISIEPKTVHSMQNSISKNAVDGYDLLILESMQENKITQIISDDGDFASVDGISLFTVNNNVLRQARAQGKLAN